MHTNETRAILQGGRAAYGAWLSVPSSYTAEVIAHQGFDWVCIDMQHGAIDYQAAIPMLQAISTTQATPIVRVPWNEHGIIGKMLDAGAMGIIIPMVNSPAEAQQAVSACRYFPRGVRSYGPVRAHLYAGANYFARANDEVMCIPMIETRRALDQLDEILDVPGIDSVYVGPADMSITLDQPPAMANGGEFEEARIRIAEACTKRGITAGIHANASLAAKHEAAGYRFITVADDVGGMAREAARQLALARGETSPGSDDPVV